MTKATDTRFEYAIPIAFPQQQWLPERDAVLRFNTNIACTVFRSVIGGDSIVRMDELSVSRLENTGSAKKNVYTL